MKLLAKHYYSWLMLLFGAGTLAMVGYIFALLFGNFTAPALNNIQVTNPTTAGQLASYEAKTCHSTNQEAEISRILMSTDSSQIVIGLDSTIIRTLRCSNIFLIPFSTPTGDYRLIITARIQVNPIRTAIEEYDSQPFHIDNPNPNIIVPSTTTIIQTIVQPSTTTTTNPGSTSTTTTSSSQAPAPAPTPAPPPPPPFKPKPGPVQRVLQMVLKALGLKG